MRNVNIILDILNQRSKNNLLIKDIFPYLYNQNFYIEAYQRLCKLYKITDMQITSNIQKRINNIINDMRYERYKWNKIIDKDNILSINFKKLSLNDWNDLVLEEVLYLILNSIYEPKFLDCSCGYRINKNYTSALKRIHDKSQACEWFIQGNIQSLYDSISYDKFQSILSVHIKDNRFIELFRRFFKANKFGYDFDRQDSYMDIPQHGILSPILTNIYLNELDQFIETKISPNFNTNDKRPFNPKYKKLRCKIDYALRRLKLNPNDIAILKEIKELRKQTRYMKCKLPIEQCSYRRLSYTRYATSWIISFTGTYQEALTILNNISTFLKENLNLDSSGKVYKSDSEKQPVEFLGYNIITQWDNNRLKDKKKTLSGQIAFLIPFRVINNRSLQYMQNNKPIHISYLINKPVEYTISYFQLKLKQIIKYYQFARNQSRLTKLKWIMEISLVKTIAAKLRTTAKKIYKKFGNIINDYKVIMYNGVYFGAIPMKVQKIKHKDDDID